MLKSIATVALTALLGSLSFGQSLHDFIVSQKWDPARSGVLIGLDMPGIYLTNQDQNAPPPTDYAAYGRSLVTVGRIKVVAPVTRLDFPADDAPNPYRSIPESDRMAALLGSFDADQWQHLATGGLAPRDLKGLQRNLLLSLVPMYAQKVTFNHNGWSSDNNPTPVDPSVYEGTKLQMFKGLDIGYGALVDKKSQGRMSYGISSLFFHPIGSEGWRVSDAQTKPGDGGYGGRIADNTSRPSQLNYKDSKLNKPISIKAGMSVDDLLAEIGDACGIEIYSDARIGKDKIDVFGDSANAGDLLQGVALCLSSTYRRVGPAYILTSDLEGQLTRGARTMANIALTENELQYKAIQGRELIDQGHLLDHLDFLPGDPFQAKTFLRSLNLSSSFGADGGWIAQSAANSPISSAIPPTESPQPQPANSVPGSPVYEADPDYANKIHVSVSVGFRWVTPDGTTIDAHGLSLGDGMTYGFNQRDPMKLPMDPSKQSKGVAVGYRSNDPGDVATFCGQAVKHGIKEIWLETQNQKALSTAVGSGLKVDLVVRPWQLFKGEEEAPDLNPLGQTGAKLNQIPAACYMGQRNETWHFADFIPASDPVPDQHLKLLTSLASTKGVNRIIVQDAIPIGYAAPSSDDYARIDDRPLFANKTEIPRNLKDLVPAIYDFGYSQRARLDCIRKHHIDPLDMENPNRHSPYVPIPFYENGPFGNQAYPNVVFSDQEAYTILQATEKDHNEVAEQGLKTMLDALSAGQREVWTQHTSGNIDFYRAYYQFGPLSKINDGYLDESNLISMLSVNPVTAEDANGVINYSFNYEMNHPFCFNFSDVPPNRLRAYFDALFKAN